jgi:hypothetical protein
MVGVYRSLDAKSHAFVKDGSEFISFDVPGATDTRGFGIDPFGQIVGRYTSDGIIHGFLRARNGSVLTIDVPGAVATEASGITPQGEITGVYRTADLRFHGYIRSTDGLFQTIDVPGAVNTGTALGGVWMAASGELAGYYQTQVPGPSRAWVRLMDDSFHTYLFPGSVDSCFFNINERGDLVGRYIANGVEHGLYVDRLGRRPPGQ